MFPPPPSWPRDEAALLVEADAPLAVLLWQRARDVRLWALAGEGSRAGLFAREEEPLDAEGLPEALAVPLRALRALVRYPEHVSGPGMAAACLAISEWAEGEHMPETALHFAEAAALADPTSARAAALAGTACTAQAADQRAELWLTRAVRTARRAGDWEWHARAYLRLGLLYYELGDVTRARRAHHRARWSAFRSGHYTYAATAHHNLLLVECSAGTFAAGDRHARLALELYSARHPRLPHLTHDVGFLMALNGAYADALALLDAALPFFTRTWERVAMMGTVALAAAGTGQRQRHAEAVTDLLLLGSFAETHAAGALALAAEGAALLGDGERAWGLAVRALELAERRREREPLRRARRVLDGVGDEPEQAPPPADRVAALRSLFLTRLRDLRTSPAAGTRIDVRQFTMSGRT